MSVAPTLSERRQVVSMGPLYIQTDKGVRVWRADGSLTHTEGETPGARIQMSPKRMVGETKIPKGAKFEFVISFGFKSSEKLTKSKPITFVEDSKKPGSTSSTSGSGSNPLLMGLAEMRKRAAKKLKAGYKTTEEEAIKAGVKKTVKEPADKTPAKSDESDKPETAETADTTEVVDKPETDAAKPVEEKTPAVVVEVAKTPEATA